MDPPTAVHDGHGNPGRTGDVEGTIHHGRHQSRNATPEFGWRTERVPEDAPEFVDRVAIAVDGERPAAPQGDEAPQLVEAEDVVRMTVGVDDRVDARQPLRQRLAAQVWRRVHQHLRPIVVGDDDGGTESLVFGRRRLADGTAAANHRNSLRRARAEKRDAHAQGVTMREGPFFEASTYFIRNS